MKVSVIEAMRMKKELSTAVGRLLSTQSASVSTTIDSTPQEQTMLPFPEYLNKLRLAFEISEKLNTALAAFSQTSGIADLVRHKANLDFFIQKYQEALMYSVPQTRTTFEIVGGAKLPTTTVFTPYLTKEAIKELSKTAKKARNEILLSIDVKNAEQIELNFTQEVYDDLVNE